MAARLRLHFPAVPLVVMPNGNNITSRGIVNFRVSPKLSKPVIRQMLEKVYGMGVIKVNTMNYAGKLKQAPGYAARYKTAKWKKAVVTVDNTDFLDLLTATPEATTTTESTATKNTQKKATK